MPSTKHRFSCGHKGRGATCHRCEQAEVLEKKAKALRDGTDEKLSLAFEARRLRSLHGSKLMLELELELESRQTENT